MVSSARGLKVAGMHLVWLGPVVLPATASCDGRPPASECPEPAEPSGTWLRAAIRAHVLTETRVSWFSGGRAVLHSVLDDILIFLEKDFF